MFGTIKGMTGPAFCLCVGIAVAGCNVDGRWVQLRAPKGPVVSDADSHSLRSEEGVDPSVADAQEVDLVEAVLTHRARYHQSLRQLHDYYMSRGYAAKEEWAAFELKGLRSVKQFRYLLDAEIPSEMLRPSKQIPGADALYQKGRDLMRSGGHGVPVLYREDRMVEAAVVLRELIEKYPTSDKIDDAAFFLGEIHKEYLPGQELLAVMWYERAWTWNPQTPHPARFQAAVVHDYRLHDRDRALELYQSVVRHETAIKSNVRWAMRRIHELTTATASPSTAQATGG